LAKYESKRKSHAKKLRCKEKTKSRLAAKDRRDRKKKHAVKNFGGVKARPRLETG